MSNGELLFWLIAFFMARDIYSCVIAYLLFRSKP